VNKTSSIGGTGVGTVVLILAVTLCLATLIVWGLYNWIAPTLGLPYLSMFQSLGLYLLCSTLFKPFPIRGVAS
jgi:hypothetical protein